MAAREPGASARAIVTAADDLGDVEVIAAAASLPLRPLDAPYFSKRLRGQRSRLCGATPRLPTTYLPVKNR